MRIYNSYLTTPDQLNKLIIRGVTAAAPYSGGTNSNLELMTGGITEVKERVKVTP
jgi:hypothetical protein